MGGAERESRVPGVGVDETRALRRVRRTNLGGQWVVVDRFKAARIQ